MVEGDPPVKSPGGPGHAPPRPLALRPIGRSATVSHVLQAGSGLATGPLPDAAFRAARDAMAKSGIERADLALVFASGDAYPHGPALSEAIRRVTGARVLVGASGAGVLCERAEAEQVPAVAVLVARAGGGLLAASALVAERERLDAEAGAELADRVGAVVAEGGTLVVLADVNLDPRGFLGGVADHLGATPVVGGVAAGAPPFELVDAEVVRGALVALALAGPAPVIGVGQGCEPIGEPYVVTRGEGNLVQAIAGRPALEVLRDAIRTVPDGPRRVSRAGIFAGLAMDPAKSPLERGDFLVRNLAGVDRESGTVAVAGDVRIGQTIQFQIRDAEAARADLAAMLDRVRRALGGRRPGFGLYANCAGRGRGLFGVPDHDTRLIRARLGAFPLAGFFGNGELAPVGGANFFHTYTGALVVFPAG
jgi:small ligand-binding sensory domain FIST